MVSYKALNTILECSIGNDFHRVGNRDGSQACTFIEDMVIQFLDGIGKRDGGQTDATREGFPPL